MIISSIRAAAFNIFLKSNKGVVSVYQAATDVYLKARVKSLHGLK